MPIQIIMDRRVTRWLALLAFGLACLFVFILLAFSQEFLILVKIIEGQLANFVDISPSEYNPKLKILVVLFIVSMASLVMASFQITQFLINALVPEKKGRLLTILKDSSTKNGGPRIVVLGGGTGLNSLLSGLKKYTSNITAIVSVADEGKSSRRLRNEFGVLPPGDIRNCLVALSESSPMMSKLLQYRFIEGKGLKGHSFGNLLLTAMTRITGSFEKGLEETEKLLAIRGRVLPVSLGKTSLCATLENGKTIREEPNVEIHKTKYKSEIKKLYLDPQVKAYGEALKAIHKADLIVLGPGSLYTSILPNILTTGIPHAIKNARAQIAYVCNVMTQPGETDNYTVSDHVRKIVEHLGEGQIDYVIVNRERAAKKLYEKYKKEGSTPVELDLENLGSFSVVKANLLTKNNLLRHDVDKLARVVLALTKK